MIPVRFSDQQKIVTIPIAIVGGGNTAESPENFTVELEIPKDTKDKGVVAVEPSTAEIVITDGMKFTYVHICNNHVVVITRTQNQLSLVVREWRVHEPSQLLVCLQECLHLGTSIYI